MDISGFISNIALNAESCRDETTEEIGADGLRYCTCCRGARQKVINNGHRDITVSCLCKCMAERRDRDIKIRKAREEADKLDRYRSIGIPDAQTRGYTFAADDGKDPRIINAAKKYCEVFPEWKKDGRGLLLYGPCGSGKSFVAGCIVNQLIDSGEKVLFTNVQRITESTKDFFSADRQDYIDSLTSFSLVVLDDLGVERQTQYMNERTFEIIDTLYRGRTPIIVTTNLDPYSMSRDEELSHKRIYDRLLERCHPVEVSNASRRIEAGRNSFRTANEALGL